MQAISIPPKNDAYIVGYAGHIRTLKNRCGNTFGDTQREITYKNFPSFKKSSANPSWAVGGRREMEQKRSLKFNRSHTVAASLPNFQSENTKSVHDGHPILIERQNSKMIAGYKAHIPNYKWQVGSGFTNCANMARWNLQEKLNRPQTAKINLPSKFLRSSTDLAETYQPISKNVITNYSGHVPGLKFSHGKSFARLTSSKIY